MYIQGHTKLILYFLTRSYDGTTQPYVASTTAPPAQTPKYYQKSTEYTTKSTTTTKITTTTTTEKPYFQFTTRKPYQFFTEKTTKATLRPSSIVTYPSSINKYSITSTKSPYDFKDFTTKPPTPASSTEKRGFYKKEDFDGFFRHSTTKSPYQDKGIRPVFKIGTYYSQAKSSDNSIRPDANSQQVQIEPARFMFPFRRNLTSGELVRQ